MGCQLILIATAMFNSTSSILTVAAGLLVAAFVQADDAPLPPQSGQWTASVGGAYYALKADFQQGNRKNADVGGVVVGVEHRFLPSFSVALAVEVTPQTDLGLFRAHDLLLSGDTLRADLTMQGVTASLTGKLFPLRLINSPVGQSRFQPYVVGGVGTLILPWKLNGQYRHRTDSEQIQIRATEVVGVIQAGVGADAHLSRHWTLFIESLYLFNFTEPSIEVRSQTASKRAGIGLEIRGLTLRIGIRHVF